MKRTICLLSLVCLISLVAHADDRRSLLPRDYVRSLVPGSTLVVSAIGIYNNASMMFRFGEDLPPGYIVLPTTLLLLHGVSGVTSGFELYHVYVTGDDIRVTRWRRIAALERAVLAGAALGAGVLLIAEGNIMSAGLGIGFSLLAVGSAATALLELIPYSFE